MAKLQITVSNRLGNHHHLILRGGGLDFVWLSSQKRRVSYKGNPSCFRNSLDQVHQFRVIRRRPREIMAHCSFLYASLGAPNRFFSATPFESILVHSFWRLCGRVRSMSAPYHALHCSDIAYIASGLKTASAIDTSNFNLKHFHLHHSSYPLLP